MDSCRLWAISLLLEILWGRMQRRTQHKWAVMSMQVWHSKPQVVQASVDEQKRVLLARLPMPSYLQLTRHSHSHAYVLTCFAFIPTDFWAKEPLLKSRVQVVVLQVLASLIEFWHKSGHFVFINLQIAVSFYVSTLYCLLDFIQTEPRVTIYVWMLLIPSTFGMWVHSCN